MGMFMRENERYYNKIMDILSKYKNDIPHLDYRKLEAYINILFCFSNASNKYIGKYGNE